MKSAQDRDSYNNEFKDLQVQLFDISTQTFNGVSLFASINAEGGDAIFLGTAEQDNTISIFTSTSGGGGSKVSVHKALLVSALTFGTEDLTAVKHSDADNSDADGAEGTDFTMTLATASGGTLLDLDDISVGVITKALENVSYLRSQNGGTQSRLTFNLESLTQQKTNMRAALGRIADVDIAEESSNLAKYSILNQAAASMLAQANASTDVALMLLR